MTDSPARWFAPENADQSAAWNGAEGQRWTEHADRYDVACGRFDRWLLDAAKIAVDDAVLDIGCGCGVSTRAAARAARRGSVLGLDLSAPMLQRARERARAEGLENARFERGDAQVFELEPSSFDVAISRFGCMFFADRAAAFRNIAAALRPGGRLALLTWRPLADNEWVGMVRDALAAGRSLPDRPPGTPGPFGMADGASSRELLVGAGFERVELTTVDGPVILGKSPDDAFGFVRSMGLTLALLEGLDDAGRTRALDDLAKMLAARATPEGVHLKGGAWLITARRR